MKSLPFIREGGAAQRPSLRPCVPVSRDPEQMDEGSRLKTEANTFP